MQSVPWQGGRVADDNSVLAVNQAFYDSIESGDLDLMKSVWTPRADAVCVHPGGELVRGQEQVMRAWAVIMANVGYIQFFLTDVKLAIAPGEGDPNVAVVTCAENILSGTGQDDTLAGGKAIATNVFIREGTTWRIWMHHSSPVAIAVDE